MEFGYVQLRLSGIAIASSVHWHKARPHLQKDSHMLGFVNRFRRDERGATATEYAMLVVFVALAVAVGASALGGGINTLFNKVNTQLTGVTPQPLPPTTPSP
jgi:pilus assembly protein Flp/PilA